MTEGQFDMTQYLCGFAIGQVLGFIGWWLIDMRLGLYKGGK